MPPARPAASPGRTTVTPNSGRGKTVDLADRTGFLAASGEAVGA
jgi:hypothetical protein